MPTIYKAIFTLVVMIAICLTAPTVRADNIVNIDATLYGYNFPTDPAPVPGQIITPFSLAPGGVLNQLTLGAGTYTVRNAAGMVGANPNFTGYRFNGGTSANWAWAFVISDATTNQVLLYGEAGLIRNSQAEVVADPNVQNFSTTFTLTRTTTLNFMIRDYFLPDNAGGVALLIQPTTAPTAVPEPATMTLLGTALVGVAAKVRKRRKANRTTA